METHACCLEQLKNICSVAARHGVAADQLHLSCERSGVFVQILRVADANGQVSVGVQDAQV